MTGKTGFEVRPGQSFGRTGKGIAVRFSVDIDFLDKPQPVPIIKQARSSAEFGGFTWDGSPFDSDAISQSRIQGALQLAAMAPGFTIDWTLANNSVRNLSAADLANVGAALGMHVAAQHAKARLLRSQIEVATTVAEVDAVTW